MHPPDAGRVHPKQVVVHLDHGSTLYEYRDLQPNDVMLVVSMCRWSSGPLDVTHHLALCVEIQWGWMD